MPSWRRAERGLRAEAGGRGAEETAAQALAEEGGGNNSLMLDDIWVLMENGFVDVGYAAVECATLDGTSDLLDPISEGEAHKKSRTYLVRNEAEKIAIGNYEFDIDKGN